MSEANSFNFTVTRLAALTPPESGETTLRDTGVDGLCIRIRASGAASFMVRYRIKGDNRGPQRMTIGPVGAIPLPDARLQAQAALLAARQGQDPQAGRKVEEKAASEAENAITLNDLIERHEREQKAHGIVSAAEASKSMQRELAGLLTRDPASLKRQEIVAIYDKMRDGVPGHAKPRPGSVMTLRARVHGLLAFGENAGLVPTNVMAGYRSKRKSKAQRVADARRAESAQGVMLGMPEVAALWRACGDARVSQSFGAYIRLLLVTGCRRKELAHARLPWIKAAAKDRPALLMLPAEATKSGRAHVVPLPALPAGVIAGVRRYRDVDLITPGAISRKTGKTAAISGWSKSWPALLKIANEYGLTRHVKLHDLRKTFRSHLTRLGIRDRVAEAMLNHAPTDRLIQTYDMHDFLAERIEAMALWCGEIETAVDAHEKATRAEIVPLRPGTRAEPRTKRVAA